MATKEWLAVAETVEALLKKWKSNLHSYDATKSLEDLGREREKWCLMCAGLELLFREFNECIAAFEDSVEARKERLSDDKPIHNNPFREERD